MTPRDDQPPHAPPAHAVARYREERVNHLSQKELILMLYDGAIRFCEEGGAAIGDGDVPTSYVKLVRAREVVTELLAILNPDITVAPVDNLRRLYDFCIYGITEANFTKDVKLLDAVLRVLRGLRDTWAEIDFDAAVREVLGEVGPANGNGATPEEPGNGAVAGEPSDDVPAAGSISLMA